MKTKRFDCVEMKRKTQEALLGEFEQRQDKSISPAQFLDAKSKQSVWVTDVWNRFRRKQAESAFLTTVRPRLAAKTIPV